MKLKLPEKFVGHSWQRWFMDMLTLNGFTRIKTATYANKQGVQVRILRHKKKYQVFVNNELSKELEFSFPHLTGNLYITT